MVRRFWNGYRKQIEKACTAGSGAVTQAFSRNGPRVPSGAHRWGWMDEPRHCPRRGVRRSSGSDPDERQDRNLERRGVFCPGIGRARGPVRGCGKQRRNREAPWPQDGVDRWEQEDGHSRLERFPHPCDSWGAELQIWSFDGTAFLLSPLRWKCSRSRRSGPLHRNGYA